jgi:hypothetical protein
MFARNSKTGESDARSGPSEDRVNRVAGGECRTLQLKRNR